MRAVAIIAVALLTSPAATADEGEFTFSASAGLDAAWLHHPLAPLSILPSSPAPVTPLPRVVIEAGFGLKNDLALTFGVAVAATTNVNSPDVVLAGVPARIVTGTYGELAMPVGVRWQFASGLPVSVDAGIDVAPALAGYLHSVAINAVLKSGAGRALPLPLTVPDAVIAGAAVHAYWGADLRLGDASGALRAVGSVAYFDGFVFCVGGVIVVTLAESLGPL